MIFMLDDLIIFGSAAFAFNTSNWQQVCSILQTNRRDNPDCSRFYAGVYASSFTDGIVNCCNDYIKKT